MSKLSRPRQVLRDRGGRPWTADEVRELPLIVNLETAGSILGVTDWTARNWEREGRFPVPIHANGRRRFVIRADLMAFLGISES